METCNFNSIIKTEIADTSKSEVNWSYLTLYGMHVVCERVNGDFVELEGL